jgi:aspartate/methionine/tyrosine aminotransferase
LPSASIRNWHGWLPDSLSGRCQWKWPTDSLKGTRFGLGAYSESKGVRFIREAVAHFIAQRDGIPSDPDAIYLTDGASKGVQAALRMLISGPGDGIMVPIPQYPLYSATITLYEGKQVNYYLDEHNDWKLSRQMLDESLAEARRTGITVKGIVVINPGNPTGSVLDAENIGMIIDFAKEHGLTILADEVYQENIYHPKDRFTSFAKVMAGRNETDVSLFSFHSTSKGFLGECGHRGGYFEIRNIPADVDGPDTETSISKPLCQPSWPDSRLLHGQPTQARLTKPQHLHRRTQWHTRIPSRNGPPSWQKG